MSNLLHSHEAEDIRSRLEERRKANYLRDFIYGSIDGTVTTFAIISGVFGAGLSNQTIIILGFANVLADGFSMAASNYLGTKAEIDEKNKLRQFELTQLRRAPGGELAEIREIFRLKGFSGPFLEEIVKIISKDEKEWVKIMLQEEYGIGDNERNALHSGVATFVAFIFFGFLPLIPFLLNTGNSFTISTVLAGISFFVVGSFKSRWSLEKWWLSGIKTFLIGLVASLIAYYVGNLLK